MGADGLPCGDLAPCKRDAERFLEQFTRVEIINKTTGRVVHTARRRAIK